MAKIFTSGHSKVGFDRTPRTPPGYGYASYSSSKPQLETPPELDTPGKENVEVNTGRIYLEFTVEEQLLFERRYEEGYDVCDDKYSAWLVQERGLSPCSSMIMCP